LDDLFSVGWLEICKSLCFAPAAISQLPLYAGYLLNFFFFFFNTFLLYVRAKPYVRVVPCEYLNVYNRERHWNIGPSSANRMGQ
jgi:hypothetical protein